MIASFEDLWEVTAALLNAGADAMTANNETSFGWGQKIGKFRERHRRLHIAPEPAMRVGGMLAEACRLEGSADSTGTFICTSTKSICWTGHINPY